MHSQLVFIEMIECFHDIEYNIPQCGQIEESVRLNMVQGMSSLNKTRSIWLDKNQLYLKCFKKHKTRKLHSISIHRTRHVAHPFYYSIQLHQFCLPIVYHCLANLTEKLQKIMENLSNNRETITPIAFQSIVKIPNKPASDLRNTIHLVVWYVHALVLSLNVSDIHTTLQASISTSNIYDSMIYCLFTWCIQKTIKLSKSMLISIQYNQMIKTMDNYGVTHSRLLTFYLRKIYYTPTIWSNKNKKENQTKQNRIDLP